MNWTRGHLGPGKSDRFFAFLAIHRNRLHAWVIGGSHLILIVCWDVKGKAKDPLVAESDGRTDAD